MNSLQTQFGVVHLVIGCLPEKPKHDAKPRFSAKSEHFGPRVHNWHRRVQMLDAGSPMSALQTQNFPKVCQGSGLSATF